MFGDSREVIISLIVIVSSTEYSIGAMKVAELVCFLGLFDGDICSGVLVARAISLLDENGLLDETRF